MPIGTATDSTLITVATTSPFWMQVLHDPAQGFLVWGGAVLLVLRITIAVRVLLRWRNQGDINP